MSIVAALLTMRAVVKRNESAVDGYGQKPAAGDWQIVSAAEPCLVTTRDPRLVVDNGRVLTVEDIRGLFGPAADIQVGDRIEQLTNRHGDTVLSGTLYIDAVTEKSAGAVVLQKEAVLRRHRG